MSEVKVNKISPRSGTDVTLGDSGDTFTVPSGATFNVAGTLQEGGSALVTGKILQVLQGTLTTSVSTTSTSYIDLVTVAITPSATSSKIYVSFTTNAGTDGDVCHLYTSLFRDSTEIGSATSTGSRTGAQAVTNTGTGQQFSYTGANLDSPSSTSSITYAVKIMTSQNTGYWNRNQEILPDGS